MMRMYKKAISFSIHGGSKVQITPYHRHFYHSSSTTDLVLHRIGNFLSIQSPKTFQSLAEYHAYIITTGHHSTNIFISSKLISLYTSLHKPASAKRVFDSFNGYKDVFLWNSIIKAYFSNGMYHGCLDSYASMRVLSTFLPNQFTIPMIVSACAEIGDLIYGVIVHGLVCKIGVLQESSAVGSSFVYMYSKCGYVENARKVFDEMFLRDVVAWTALVIGYVQNADSEKGLRCICEMYKTSGKDERPNFRTLEGGFQACGDLEAVITGRCLHGVATKSGLGCSLVVQSSILYMYSKCGTINEAYISFCEIPVKDIKLWTSIISAYGKWGRVAQCLCAFMEMVVSGIHPDPMVISCVISVLANSLCISAGKTFHGFLIRRNCDQDQMAHSALVSMYCKFAQLSYAENLFNSVDDNLLDEEIYNAMNYER